VRYRRRRKRKKEKRKKVKKKGIFNLNRRIEKKKDSIQDAATDSVVKAKPKRENKCGG
jgi:hypothetical protein